MNNERRGASLETGGRLAGQAVIQATVRARLSYQDFEGYMGFHQTGLPFFRTPNSVLQCLHSYT